MQTCVTSPIYTQREEEKRPRESLPGAGWRAGWRGGVFLLVLSYPVWKMWFGEESQVKSKVLQAQSGSGKQTWMGYD